MDNESIKKAMVIKLEDSIPDYPKILPGYRRAPKRESNLSENDKALAVKNALRYIPEQFHKQMAKEFYEELKELGRIYGYRYRPEGAITAKPIDEYKGNCVEGKAFQVMIDNNLDFQVALYPYELVTYGETGQLCQNWMQYQLIKKYLEVLNHNQTLVIESGHPLGLFQSHELAPRVMITNGLMVGAFDNPTQFNRAAALGVANYGQMTAGGWMYIGPQGIVHGTFNTLLNAGRIKLGISKEENLAGKLFVSSGLGGMSGAQGKAAKIGGAVSIIAEVDQSRIKTRYEQGWIQYYSSNLEEIILLSEKKLENKEAFAIGYYGNVIDLLEYLVEKNIQVDLLSDQTSCHVQYDGGYCPQGLTFEERTRMLADNREEFSQLVDKSLKHHFELICELTKRGTYFFDYGNSFLKSVYDSGVKEVCKNLKDEQDGFIFPSYVEDILGPQLFDYGYGPFRWVCLSGKQQDLNITDKAAMECIDTKRRYQDLDNYIWIRDAALNELVVGTKARILYQDAMGRTRIALRFNQLIREGIIGPIMLGRDHHDTGGTDSPYRETSNIKDGSNIMAEMATHCFAGNAARGMSLVALHNGGGVGVGKAINGGFGMVLDGSERVDTILRMALPWDTMIGVARRSWARNENSVDTCIEYNKAYGEMNHITIPYIADEELIRNIL